MSRSNCVHPARDVDHLCVDCPRRLIENDMSVMIELSDEEFEYARGIGTTRHEESLKKGLKDKHGMNSSSRMRGVEADILGALGEAAVAKSLGMKYVGTVNTFKSGQDVEGFQVRTRSKLEYDLIVRDDDRSGDTFVLVIGTVWSRVFEVVGSINGAEAKKPMWRHSYGNREPAFFVPRSALARWGEKPIGQSKE